MPNLSEGQFERLPWRDALESSQPAIPGSLEGVQEVPSRREAIEKVERRHPGPDAPRGDIPGQQVMNFDRPKRQLEVGGSPKRTTKFDMQGKPHDVDSPSYATPPAIHVTEQDDPTYDSAMFRVGGGVRGGRMAEHQEITKRWEESPLETIGPEAQLRTGQGAVMRPRADEIRDVPPQEYEAHPWVAKMQGKSYVLEGHHRLSAARRRGTGEVQAHVVEAEDTGDLIRKMRGLPPDPARNM